MSTFGMICWIGGSLLLLAAAGGYVVTLRSRLRTLTTTTAAQVTWAGTMQASLDGLAQAVVAATTPTPAAPLSVDQHAANQENFTILSAQPLLHIRHIERTLDATFQEQGIDPRLWRRCLIGAYLAGFAEMAFRVPQASALAEAAARRSRALWDTNENASSTTP